MEVLISRIRLLTSCCCWRAWHFESLINFSTQFRRVLIIGSASIFKVILMRMYDSVILFFFFFFLLKIKIKTAFRWYWLRGNYSLKVVNFIWKYLVNFVTKRNFWWHLNFNWKMEIPLWAPVFSSKGEKKNLWSINELLLIYMKHSTSLYDNLYDK